MNVRRFGPLACLAIAIVAIGFVNFIWFVTEAGALGGDALNGYRAAGKFFLGNHGHFIEVDQVTWQWSRIHAISVLATHPLAIVSLGYIGSRVLRNIGQRTTPLAEPARRGERPLATTRCSGRIGTVSFNGSNLKVAVFSDRLTVRPTLTRGLTILSSEIKSLRVEGGGRRKRHGLVIEHAATGIRSPITMYLGEDPRVQEAIERIAVRSRLE